MLAKPAVPGRELFKPDYIVDAVTDIDFGWLISRGIKAVFIDLDGTVVHRGMYDVEKKLSSYLKKQPVQIYIATNRRKGRDLKNLKELLHAEGVIHPKGIFMKPLPRYYRRALSDHGLDGSEVAMVGDRYVQDIFGANLAGLTTISVRKLGDAKGHIDTYLSRIEKRYTDKLATTYTELT